MFFAFLNGALLSALLALMVWCVLRVSRRTVNAATRYAVWWIALVVVTLIPVLLTPRGAFPSPRVLREAPRPVRIEERSAATHQVAATFVSAVTPPSRTGLQTRFAFDPGVWPSRLSGVWAVAACLSVFRLVVSFLHVRRRKRDAVEAPPALAARVQRLLARAGVKRGARVAILDGPASPMVAGPFDPCILLPARLLTALEPAELEQVCLHEAAHLARFDDCALIAQRLVEAVFALHPVVRWIARQIDLEREIACDDFVIASAAGPASYARCLTHIAELNILRASPFAAPAFGGTSNFTRRIDMLLNKNRHRGTHLLKLRLALAGAGFVLATGVAVRTQPLFALAPQRAPRPQGAVSVPPPALAPAHAPAMVAQVRVPQPPPVKTQAEIVQVPVSVTDPLNRFVTGLYKGDFGILEDSVEQPLVQFFGADQPVSVCVLWDFRGGSQDPQKFVDLRKQLADLSLVYKPSHPAILSLQKDLEALERSNAAPFNPGAPADPADLISVMQVNQPDGMLRSLHAAEAQLAGVPAWRKAIVIASAVLPSEGFRVGGTGLPVYFITAGQANSFAEMPAAIRRIETELRNTYVLGYIPRNTPDNNRNISVKITPPRGLPALTVRHLATYSAGLK